MTPYRRLFLAVGAWRDARTAWDARTKGSTDAEDQLRFSLSTQLDVTEYEMTRAHVACGKGPPEPTPRSLPIPKTRPNVSPDDYVPVQRRRTS